MRHPAPQTLTLWAQRENWQLYSASGLRETLGRSSDDSLSLAWHTASPKQRGYTAVARTP